MKSHGFALCSLLHVRNSEAPVGLVAIIRKHRSDLRACEGICIRSRLPNVEGRERLVM